MKIGKETWHGSLNSYHYSMGLTHVIPVQLTPMKLSNEAVQGGALLSPTW